MLVYITIFLFKIIEDTLATIRLIFISNEKKFLGAILQFICTVIWIILTGSILIDFMKDKFKIVAFSLGSLFGTYLGCFIEEKLALGINSFTVKIKKDKISLLSIILDNLKVYYINVDDVFFIILPRKNTKTILSTIRKIDCLAEILCTKVKIL